ncbi:MAG: ABC transporter ATP-binding protein [Caldimonas sp.]
MSPITLDIESLELAAGGEASGRLLFTRLDAHVGAGERWVVVGPNGAGKSSLLAALAGVFPVQGGSVRVDGRLLGDWPAAALAARRAWSPQFWSDPFPSTVTETAALACGRGAAWAPWAGAKAAPVVDAVLTRLGLHELAAADVQTLSGGERQRVAIATALLQQAPLLLLDEPASHLDPAHQRLLLAVLREHAQGGGAVVASLHDLDLAWDLASHCILLDGRGQAVAGERAAVLDAARLSKVFGVDIEAVDVKGARRFVVVDGGELPGGMTPGGAVSGGAR